MTNVNNDVKELTLSFPFGVLPLVLLGGDSLKDGEMASGNVFGQFQTVIFQTPTLPF